MKKSPRKRRKTSILSVVQDLVNTANVSFAITEGDRSSQTDIRVENQTKIFASMCPDEILDHYDNYETRSYRTTLMLGDVSGFTEMTDKYTKSGKGGPSKLSETLNSYIGAMVQEILSHNGDVLKFSGDAFIVMWKLEGGRVMRDIASDAIKTACIIQKHFGTYETEVDVTLKVKLAIASGKTYFTSIGDEKVSYYIITGKPVWEVKYAEGLCRGGDILVAPSCWQWINPNEYLFEMLPDGIHTLILSLSVLWDAGKNSYENMSTGTSNYDGSTEVTSSSGSNVSSNASLFMRLESLTDKTPEDVTDYSLRPKVIKASKAKLSEKLRCFIIRPVIRSVEIDEPLEYLTEIRQVVIVFVNVITEEMNRKSLIKLVNAAFLYVCNVVGKMQGCVNKTSLFDKDLLFLCIFGLRGSKHEVESQVGLRCATKLRRGLAKFDKVKSVTIGVTTGMTYCGVVGHVLRREYTVIGMAVNKAARLMCAYVDKVVCDRESFLLSHLEAKHFILQEPKELKGITNVGPIYEFSEQITQENYELSANKYPLLGRDIEIGAFRKIIENMLKEENDGVHKKNAKKTKTNVLIIRGEPRIGKTRLLEEMAFLTPSNVPVNFISLAPYDRELPYVLLRMIYFVPLDISEASPMKEKQEKLYSHFPETDYPKLAALNHVFNVNFQMTSDLEGMDERGRKKILKKLLMHLTSSCFERFWVIIIDDAELADDESISLIFTVIKPKNLLLIFSYGNKMSNDYMIPIRIRDIATVVELEGLDKWYHAGFACQVLDVVAIPAELEKLIQERSGGSPGWIESYLISLIQSKAMAIENLPRQHIYKIGLVTPPIYMLRRFPEESGIPSTVSDEDLRRWEMYRSSLMESTKENEDEKYYNATEDQKVCLLSENIASHDFGTEITMDALLLKLYDSLTPLDQFLLKCAATLGEIIDRKMLERLMHGTSERDIGSSIVKLFELRIIGCAFGDDHNKSTKTTTTSFRKSQDNMFSCQIRCDCKGIVISEALADFPDYASCGLMRFKLVMFRETTYGLLTENQKVEFHSKALKYLQQTTRRCAACGGGQFNKLLGESTLKDIGKKKPSSTINNNESRISMISDFEQLIQEFKSSNSDQSINKSDNNLGLLSICKPIEKSPTYTFINADFTNCECNLQLLTVYTHVMEHCRGIGVKKLLLTAILEFVEVCISTLNIPQAMKLLNEGDSLISQIYNSVEDELIVLPYLKGKILTLRGRCYLESGLTTEALKSFEQTIKTMGYSIPTNSILINLKSMFLLKQLHLTVTILRRFRIGILDGDAANYNDQFASCLSWIFIVYRLKGMVNHARLAAIWGLNVALESSKDFIVLCNCYANMIFMAHSYSYNSIIPHLTVDAVNLCYQRKDSVELQDLTAICALYTRIFFSRYLLGLQEKATSIGFVALKLAHSVRSMHFRLILLPRQIQLLLMESKYGEIVTLLQELEFVSQAGLDQSGRTWYYALCMDLLLESGISLTSLQECEQFYQLESTKIINLNDLDAARRFFISMWLW